VREGVSSFMCTETEGPQNTILHGQSVAVVISQAMFDRLTANELSLVDFTRRSPLNEAEDLTFEGVTSLTRDVSL